jgi:hypothetical protein
VKPTPPIPDQVWMLAITNSEGVTGWLNTEEDTVGGPPYYATTEEADAVRYARTQLQRNGNHCTVVRVK